MEKFIVVKNLIIICLNVGLRAVNKKKKKKFCSKISVPRALSVPLGHFQFFSKICGDIRKSMLINSVNNTNDKRGKF